MQHPLDMPLVQLRHRHRLDLRARLLIAVAIVIAVAAGAVSWNLKHNSVLPISGSWQTKRLPELGIQFSYPSSWHLQDINHNLRTTTLIGALVSNIDHGFEHPNLGDGETSAFDMSGLPANLVVLSFEQMDRFNTASDETFGLPLTLEGAQMVTDSTSYGSPQPRYFLQFGVENHRRSNLHLYIGEVSDMQLAAVEMILASVRPLP